MDEKPDFQTTSTGQKYVPIGEEKNSNLRPTQIGEPILLNPNSYNNVKTILDCLKTNLEIDKTRQWTYVGCDGPPYCLASRLITENQDNYDWLTLVPGLGHLNMNQLKSFFKVSI